MPAFITRRCRLPQLGFVRTLPHLRSFAWIGCRAPHTAIHTDLGSDRSHRTATFAMHALPAVALPTACHCPARLLRSLPRSDRLPAARHALPDQSVRFACLDRSIGFLPPAPLGSGLHVLPGSLLDSGLPGSCHGFLQIHSGCWILPVGSTFGSHSPLTRTALPRHHLTPRATPAHLHIAAYTVTAWFLLRFAHGSPHTTTTAHHAVPLPRNRFFWLRFTRALHTRYTLRHCYLCLPCTPHSALPRAFYMPYLFALYWICAGYVLTICAHTVAVAHHALGRYVRCFTVPLPFAVRLHVPVRSFTHHAFVCCPTRARSALRLPRSFYVTRCVAAFTVSFVRSALLPHYDSGCRWCVVVGAVVALSFVTLRTRCTFTHITRILRTVHTVTFLRLDCAGLHAFCGSRSGSFGCSFVPGYGFWFSGFTCWLLVTRVPTFALPVTRIYLPVYTRCVLPVTLPAFCGYRIAAFARIRLRVYTTVLRSCRCSRWIWFVCRLLDRFGYLWLRSTTAPLLRVLPGSASHTLRLPGFCRSCTFRLVLDSCPRIRLRVLHCSCGSLPPRTGYAPPHAAPRTCLLPLGLHYPTLPGCWVTCLVAVWFAFATFVCFGSLLPALPRAVRSYFGFAFTLRISVCPHPPHALVWDRALLPLQFATRSLVAFCTAAVRGWFPCWIVYLYTVVGCRTYGLPPLYTYARTFALRTAHGCLVGCRSPGFARRLVTRVGLPVARLRVCLPRLPPHAGFTGYVHHVRWIPGLICVTFGCVRCVLDLRCVRLRRSRTHLRFWVHVATRTRTRLYTRCPAHRGCRTRLYPPPHGLRLVTCHVHLVLFTVLARVHWVYTLLPPPRAFCRTTPLHSSVYAVGLRTGFAARSCHVAAVTHTAFTVSWILVTVLRFRSVTAARLRSCVRLLRLPDRLQHCHWLDRLLLVIVRALPPHHTAFTFATACTTHTVLDLVLTLVVVTYLCRIYLVHGSRFVLPGYGSAWLRMVLGWILVRYLLVGSLVRTPARAHTACSCVHWLLRLCYGSPHCLPHTAHGSGCTCRARVAGCSPPHAHAPRAATDLSVTRTRSRCGYALHCVHARITRRLPRHRFVRGLPRCCLPVYRSRV